MDTLAGQVTAGAGITVAELQAHAAAAGLEYGISLASRDSATVGGTIATNAGGLYTVRYGGTRAQLLGVEAVLADGGVISRLGGVGADNTGYDLAQLLAGSEGTLGVVTAARLRLWPVEPHAVTVLAGVGGIETAIWHARRDPLPRPRRPRRGILRGRRAGPGARAHRAARATAPRLPGLPAG